MTMHAQHVQVPSEVGRVTQRRIHFIILEIANIQAKLIVVMRISQLYSVPVRGGIEERMCACCPNRTIRLPF